MSLPLTQRQAECLEIIRKGKMGLCPNYDEIKDALGLRAKSGVHRIITALEERGFVERIPGKARAVRVVSAAPSSCTNLRLDDDVMLLAMKAAEARGEPLKEYIESAICALAEVDLG